MECAEGTDCVWDGGIVTVDLSLLELHTGQIVSYDGIAPTYVPPYDSSMPGRRACPAWSADCARIANLIDTENIREGLIRVVNLATGQVETEVGLTDILFPSERALSWSPDGRFWCLSDRLVEVAAPHRVWPIGGGMRLPGLWSPDGMWLVLGKADPPDGWGPVEDWGELRLYEMGESGPLEARSLGSSCPCGWAAGGRFYFIRWPGWQYRIRYWEELPGWEEDWIQRD